jgi:hypothetical protein
LFFSSFVFRSRGGRCWYVIEFFLYVHNIRDISLFVKIYFSIFIVFSLAFENTEKVHFFGWPAHSGRERSGAQPGRGVCRPPGGRMMRFSTEKIKKACNNFDISKFSEKIKSPSEDREAIES